VLQKGRWYAKLGLIQEQQQSAAFEAPRIQRIWR